MSVIQIYYVSSERVLKNMPKYGVDLDISVRMGNKTLDEVYNEIKRDPKFCRDEQSIDYTHFLSIIRNGITLYADLDGKVAGALSFAFNIKDREKVIMFEGICSPKIYSGQCVGQELINSLIRIGKLNDLKYIFLKCKGDIIKYYRDKFGFEVIDQSQIYDSDDSDDEGGEFYYDMRLDLTKVSGGNIKKRKSIKRKNKKRFSPREKEEN